MFEVKGVSRRLGMVNGRDGERIGVRPDFQVRTMTVFHREEGVVEIYGTSRFLEDIQDDESELTIVLVHVNVRLTDSDFGQRHSCHVLIRASSPQGLGHPA